MQDPTKDPRLMKDPDADLDLAERGALVSLLDMPGWPPLQKLMLLEVSRFDLALKNADPADEKKVLAAHIKSQTISQWYVQLIKRLNKEKEVFHSSQLPSDIPMPSIVDELTEV